MEVLINIDVPDLAAAIAFYEQATGLRLGRMLFDGTVGEMTGASARVFLLQKEPGSLAVPNAAPAREYRRHWTPVHLDFAVPDLDAAVAQAISAGAKLDIPVQDLVWGRQLPVRSFRSRLVPVAVARRRV